VTCGGDETLPHGENFKKDSPGCHPFPAIPAISKSLNAFFAIDSTRE
jgi:hypothetical protein